MNLQPQTVIVLAPPAPAPRRPADFTLPKAKAPAILMILAGLLNGGAFFFLGIEDGFDDGVIEYGISFGLYTIVGILATITAFRKQTTRILVIALLVVSSVAIAYVSVEITLQSIATFISGLAGIHAEDEETRQFALLLLAILAVLLFISICVFILCIVLIVFASQKVCECCLVAGPSPGVVYQAAPTTAPPIMARPATAPPQGM